MKEKIGKIKQFIVKKYKWIVLFICVLVFIDIAEDVFAKEIMQKDIIGYNLIATYLISDTVTPIAKGVTQFGDAIILVSLTIILFVIIKDKKIGLSIAINLIIITILNLLLKHIVQRPRPTEFRIIDETGYSFPSGHSMISMAFYGFLIYLIHKKLQNTKIKYTLSILLSILIVSIGITRIYLGVHYTSDVLAGFAVSISYLLVYTSIIRRFVLEKGEELKNEK